MSKKESVSNLIYDYVDYMYCDNCRFNHELMEESESACEDCHRKYNGWGISRGVADTISEKILKLLESEERCGDCEYYKYKICQNPNGLPRYLEESEFCSNWKKREDEQIH